MRRILLLKDQSGSTVLNTLEALKGGGREASQERIAVIQAGKKERDDKLNTSFLGQIATDGGNATQMEKADFGEEGDVGLHGQRGVHIDAKALDSRGERYCCVGQLKIGRSEGHDPPSRTDDKSFSLLTVQL